MLKKFKYQKEFPNYELLINIIIFRPVSIHSKKILNF